MLRASYLVVITMLTSTLLWNDSYSWTTDSGQRKISVKVSKVFPSITPSEAKDAFVEYTWKKGGGLPGAVINGNGNERILIPLMATEEFIEDYKAGSSLNVLRYHLKELGPIWKTEIVNDSHSGKITFERCNNTDTEFTWEVDFMTARNHRLWKFITYRMINEASCNLQSYCAPPLVLTHTVELNTSLRINELVNQWLQFVWIKGGNLPIPVPPVPLTRDCYTRMIIPPFLIEKIQSLNQTAITYIVKNPSRWTYQVHTHVGSVQFQTITDEVSVMLWQVRIRPINGWRMFVVAFTEAVIHTLSKNFAIHIQKI